MRTALFLVCALALSSLAQAGEPALAADQPRHGSIFAKLARIVAAVISDDDCACSEGCCDFACPFDDEDGFEFYIGVDGVGCDTHECELQADSVTLYSPGICVSSAGCQAGGCDEECLLIGGCDCPVVWRAANACAFGTCGASTCESNSCASRCGNACPPSSTACCASECPAACASSSCACGASCRCAEEAARPVSVTAASYGPPTGKPCRVAVGAGNYEGILENVSAEWVVVHNRNRGVTSYLPRESVRKIEIIETFSQTAQCQPYSGQPSACQPGALPPCEEIAVPAPSFQARHLQLPAPPYCAQPPTPCTPDVVRPTRPVTQAASATSDSAICQLQIQFEAAGRQARQNQIAATIIVTEGQTAGVNIGDLTFFATAQAVHTHPGGPHSGYQLTLRQQKHSPPVASIHIDCGEQCSIPWAIGGRQRGELNITVSSITTPDIEPASYESIPETTSDSTGAYGADESQEMVVCVYPVGDLVNQIGASDDQAGARFFVQRIDYEPLVQLIRQQVATDTWKESGGQGVITPVKSNRCIVIRNTRQIQQQVAHLLEDIRSHREIKTRQAVQSFAPRATE